MEKLFKLMTCAIYPALLLYAVMTLALAAGLENPVYAPSAYYNESVLFRWVLTLAAVSLIGFIGYAVVVLRQDSKKQEKPEVSQEK